ncbi:MAG: hypothetical protein U5J97_02815 [Trueperaceae bacterium]|nr:hypothetical protein [Trueperaceae bacterium]
MGGDHCERVTATPFHPENRRDAIGEPREIEAPVVTDEHRWGTFSCEPGSVSLWVPEGGDQGGR